MHHCALFHSTSKLGPGDIYQVIHQYLLDLDIETYLRAEGEVEKIIFQVGQLLVRSWKERVCDQMESGVIIPC